MHQLYDSPDPGADWTRIQPVLDEAIDSLPDEDREAVLLRFFKDLDFRSVGSALGVSDDAAQKRVSRALERLRGFFDRHGVKVSATSLAAALTGNAVQAAPVGFVVSLAAAAQGVAALSATATTVKHALVMTTLQKSRIVGTVLVSTAVGLGVYQGSRTAAPVAPPSLAAPLAAEAKPKKSGPGQMEQLSARIASLTNALQQAQAGKEQAIAERDEALRAAFIYKELAARKEDEGAQNEAPPPTHRHCMQGMGQIMMKWALLKQTDPSALSEAEQLALSEERMKVSIELLKLVWAAKAHGMMSDDPTAEVNRNQPDSTVCFLCGALDLDQAQFTQVYALVNRFNTQALPLIPEGEEINRERMVIVKQRRAVLDKQLEPLLTPDQMALFKTMQNDLHIINPYDGSVRLGYTMSGN